jgi:hypothetical protein
VLIYLQAQEELGTFRGMGLDRLTVLWSCLQLSPLEQRQLSDLFHKIFQEHVSNVSVVTADEGLLQYHETGDELGIRNSSNENNKFLLIYLDTNPQKKQRKRLQKLIFVLFQSYIS